MTPQSMNRDEWAIFHAMNSGWTAVHLLAHYHDARQHIVGSSHGSSDVTLPDGRSSWCQTTGKGLEWGELGEKPALTVTWKTIRAWVESQPESVIQRARAMHAEWGTIIRDRHQYDVGYHPLGPSWAEKTVYGPKTQRAANAIECDARERALRRTERDLIASLAPSNEPADLLELLAELG